jgi:tetratricopeptide (TPR) repeat protein
MPGLPPAAAATKRLFADAVALHQGGDLPAAEVRYRQILGLEPGHADALHHLGLIAYATGSLDDAAGLIGESLRRTPANAAAHANLALVHHARGDYAAALAECDAALRLQRHYPEAHYNRGNALRELGRLEDAIASYERALRLRPDFLGPLVNRARTLRDLGRFGAALAGNARALALAPDLAEAHLNQAMIHLLQGDFARGLPEFEWRWRDAQLAAARRDFAVPRWHGDADLAGRTLLIHAEQGLGDTLQFARYAPLLAAAGARVVLEVQPPLKNLLRSLPGGIEVVARGDALPPFDLHCPLLSLPLALGTRLDSIPAAVPYLQPDTSRLASWQARLGPASGPRVGLIWSGNPDHNNDRNRSLPLAALAPLFRPELEFVSLQPAIRAADLETLHDLSLPLRHFGDDLHDFADTAALASCVDLIIAVDTAGAHLAGALGRPLWLLLPWLPDWRWLLGREDSPWYPTARLFRQPRTQDWASVLNAVARCLEGFRPDPSPPAA